MLHVSSRVAAMHRDRMITRPRANLVSTWTGASTSWQRTHVFPIQPTALPITRRLPDSQPHTILKRNYIFLPSTTNDMLKLIKSQSHDRERIMVKLSTRWHDQLAAVLDRYVNLLRQTSLSLLSNVKSSQVSQAPSSLTAAPISILNRYNYKSLPKWGMNRLLTHYNAKKRVFARRKKTFKTFRRMNATEVKMYREQYYAQKKLRLHQGLNRLRFRVEKKRRELKDWLLNGSGNDALNKIAAPGCNSNPAKITDSTTATWKSLTLPEPSQTSWFDAEGYPLTSREETGRFVNPWLSQSTNGENGLKKFFRWKLGGLAKKLGWDVSNEKGVHSSNSSGSEEGSGARKSLYRHDTIPYNPAAPFNTPIQETIKLAWLGHSTTLVTFPGNFTILTDPHFSNYAGPMRRNDPPPINVMELPPVDCVLISHDHMDHLDYWSILELIDSNKVKFWIVPLGIKEWIIDKAGVSPEDIVELEWWEGVRISKKAVGSADLCSSVSPEVEGLVRAFDTSSGQVLALNNKNLTRQTGKHEIVVTCTPAQHWCSRTPFDRNRRLWCSWAVHSYPTVSHDSITINSTPPTYSFYFAGDTGLPPGFPLHHQIGDRLGPFDLAAIPIGAYEPRWFMRESHCDPAEAVAIHQAIRSRRSVAIHFDTFNLADEPQAEPPRLLVDEVDRVNGEILRLAAEVVAVADEVGVAVMGVEASETVDDQIIGNGVLSDHEERNVATSGQALEGSEKLVEMLPSLVDFAVIPQGHYIESPREVCNL